MSQIEYLEVTNNMWETPKDVFNISFNILYYGNVCLFHFYKNPLWCINNNEQSHELFVGWSQTIISQCLMIRYLTTERGIACIFYTFHAHDERQTMRAVSCALAAARLFHNPGCQIWQPNWVRLVPNGIKLGLLNINFSTFWLIEPKCTDIDI